MDLIFIFTVVVVLIVLYFVYRFSYRDDKNKRYVTDDDGRIIIFHGINVISAAKSDPLRVGGTTQQDFQHIAEQWGFNAVRLLIFWDGIEPQKGQYDQEYLDRVRERLDWCEEAGLHVILDMHQDLYSIEFSGDGAPTWAIEDEGEPFEVQTPWELNYLQPAVKAAIENFWIKEKGYPELQDHFIAAMMVALDAFANHPAVIGIDLYNEPTMATLHGILHLESRYLSTFYQQAIDAIRTKHNDLWIFFEPSALGANQGFRSKLDKLKDPRIGEPRLVYFPHLYTLDLDIRGRYLGWPMFINFWAHQRRKETRKFKTPLMVGEFGLSENKPGALDFLSETLTMYDQITSGWFYWSYDRTDWGLHNDAWEDLQKTDILVRPYPQKIAGEQPYFNWQPKQQIFFLSYTYSSERTNTDRAATEVYLPPRAWPDGWNVKNQGVDISQSFDQTRNILSIHPEQPGEVNIIIHGNN